MKNFLCVVIAFFLVSLFGYTPDAIGFQQQEQLQWGLKPLQPIPKRPQIQTFDWQQNNLQQEQNVRQEEMLNRIQEMERKQQQLQMQLIERDDQLRKMQDQNKPGMFGTIFTR